MIKASRSADRDSGAKKDQQVKWIVVLWCLQDVVLMIRVILVPSIKSHLLELSLVKLGSLQTSSVIDAML